MKKVLLLDAYNLIYRARHTHMKKGEYSTVFNFFRSLRPLVEKFNPDICYFVLEGRPTRRLEIDTTYKAQRTYHDEDNFSMQRKIIISLMKQIMPIRIVKHDNFECDDVLNYYANEVHKEDKSIIVSSDTDFIQSINENTDVYNPVRKTFMEKTDYDYVSWKSLVGDKSDNILGFKGIGNKTAQKMLAETAKLNEFLDKEDNRKKFDTNKEMIRFHDVSPYSKDIKTSIVRSPDWSLLKKEFINMEFNSIISKDKTWQKYIKTFENLERYAQCQ